MIKCIMQEDKLILKGNKYFLWGIVVAVIMAIQGAYIISAFEIENSNADLFGLAFVTLWECGVLFAIWFFSKEISKYIVISNKGVCVCTWYKKDLIQWSDIKDWGLSYCGQTRGEGNTYYLYFSKHKYSVKNECKKKLKGKMIKFVMFEEDYSNAIDLIIPFCCERTAEK